MSGQLEHPTRRRELLNALEALADEEYQQRTWIARQMPPGVVFDCFQFAVNILFNDRIQVVAAAKVALRAVRPDAS